MDAEKIAKGLRPTERKAMLSKDGRGEFSSSTLDRLEAKGLVDRSLWFTDLGLAVRAILKGE